MGYCETKEEKSNNGKIIERVYKGIKLKLIANK